MVRFKNIVEEMIESKPGLEEITKKTLRNDSAVILESVVSEFNEGIILKAIELQGLDAHAYQSTLRSLTKIGKERRLKRNENPK